MGARRWCALVWLALSCSGEEGAPQTPDVEEIVAGVNRAGCLVAVCGFGVAPSHCDRVPDFQALLVAEGGAAAPKRAADYRQALASGTLTIDAARARACFDEVERTIAGCWGPAADERAYRATLADLMARRGVCAGVFVGAVPAGGSCVLDDECATGACVAQAGCPGRCVAAPGEGQRCLAIFASPSAPPRRICALALECAYAAGEERCVAPGAAGTRCRADADCDPGLGCSLDGECVDCAASPTRCARASDGTCEPGEVGGYDSDCAGRQLCLYSTAGYRCATPQPVSGSCAASRCLFPLYCNPATLICDPAPVAGQPCTAGCAAEAWCQDGTCVARKPDGASCGRSVECAGAVCNPDHLCQHPVEAGVCHYP